MKCCICGKEFEGYGNNPYPLADGEDKRCCDECNWAYVIPARLAKLESLRAYRLDIASLEERDALEIGDRILVHVDGQVRDATITRVDSASDDAIWYFGGRHSLMADVDEIGDICIDEYVVYAVCK